MSNKNSLITDIKATAQVINGNVPNGNVPNGNVPNGNVPNGNVPNGKDANFGSDFRTSRYAIILLAALTHPLFEDHKIQIENFKCFNYYRLGRVAKLLGLGFDRARTAEKIYRDLESKQKVRFFKQENQTFITFTKEGQKMSQDRLKRFQELDSYLRSNQ
jgi:hypothetical protein